MIADPVDERLVAACFELTGRRPAGERTRRRLFDDANLLEIRLERKEPIVNVPLPPALPLLYKLYAEFDEGPLWFKAGFGYSGRGQREMYCRIILQVLTIGGLHELATNNFFRHLEEGFGLSEGGIWRIRERFSVRSPSDLQRLHCHYRQGFEPTHYDTGSSELSIRPKIPVDVRLS